MTSFPMALAGEKLLKEELHQLKTVDRLEISKKIAEARDHGDLKENAEYHAAKEQQAFIEGRIAEINAKLAGAQVIDITTIPNHGKVVFGVTVHLIEVNHDKTICYRIVGEDEADLENGKISVNSPVARALIGKSEGDLVQVKTPGGLVEYEVDKVEHQAE